MARNRTASISALAMISRLVLTLFAGTVVAVADGAGDFAREVLGTEVSMGTLAVTGEVSRLCRETTGSPVPSLLSYYHSPSNGTLWVLTARGKHGPITGAFVVQGSRIRSSRILEDRERRGRGIRGKRYLRQFEGVGLRAGERLDRRVDGITGATVSSRAVEKMALLALRLEAGAKTAKAENVKERRSDE